MLEEWRATVVGDSEADEEVVSLPGTPSALAGADAVRYVTSIDDPRESDDEIAVLALNGLYAQAEVEVTGEIIGIEEDTVHHDAYFEPLRIPFRPPADGDIRIAVTCETPDDEFGGLHDSDQVPDETAVPGVWWEAAIETDEPPFVDRMTVQPALTDDGAALDVRTTVVTTEALEERLTYSLKPAGELKTRGMMNRGAVDAPGPGRTTVEHTIDVHDPALWWPRGMGQQNRYTLDAKLEGSEHSITTGIREVTSEDGDIVVNGEPCPIRGVTLKTAEPADIDRAVSVNANLVRAQAQALPPAVYEACDEAGVLVWQDLPLTGPADADVDRGRELASTLAETYGTHPSLAAFGVHDRPVEAFADGLGSGFLDGLRLRWRSWRTSVNRGPAEQIAEAFPTGAPVFPIIGGPGTGPDAAAYYPGWEYGDATGMDGLLARYPAEAVGAYGAGALGASDVDSAAGFDRDLHDQHVDTDGDDDSAVADSQAYQADVLKTVTETLRRERTIAVADTLRDTDAAGLGVFAEDGTEKAGAEALARALQPVQAFLADPSGGKTELIVVNDTAKAHSATVTWEAGDESETEELTIAEAGRWHDTVTLPSDPEAVELTVTVGDHSVTNRYE